MQGTVRAEGSPGRRAERNQSALHSWAASSHLTHLHPKPYRSLSSFCLLRRSTVPPLRKPANPLSVESYFSVASA